MNNLKKYDEAVNAINTAILQSQYDAARTVYKKTTDVILWHRQIRSLSTSRLDRGQA